jgi:hypothetical protein
MSNFKRLHTLFLGAVLAGSAVGCIDDGSADAPTSERVRSLDADLAIGSSGEDVRALNESLADWGYYPNATLGRDFPAWRPIVARGPADPSVFDEQTRTAVLALQRKSGLTQTGVVDAETRAAMRERRCGVPDGLPTDDASDKFSMINGGLGRRNLTWKIGQLSGTMDFASTSAAAASAFSYWAAQGSGVSFTQITSGTPNIMVQFGALSNPNVLGQCNGQTITMNSLLPWNNVNGSSNDLQSPLIHEIGHALGLNHAAWSSAKMYPFVGSNRSLWIDDTVAASALYDIYTQVPGAAKDVGIGANGDVWVIGTNAMGGGNFGIFKYNPATNGWTQTTDGSAAVRIAVMPDGRPVVVQASGAIWIRSTNSPTVGGFSQLNGLATDVGVGGNGEIWITNKTAVNGGFQVAKFNGSGFTASNGGAVKVSVSASGIPWIVAASGQVFRHTNNSATSGSWEAISGSLNDIGVGPDHPLLSGATTSIPFVWSVATNGSGYANLSAWAEQPFMAFGAGSDVPLAKGWLSGIAVSGGGGPNSAVAVDPTGQPWLIDNFGNIFRSVR